MHGDYDAWLSVRPDNYDMLIEMPPREQVSLQLTGLSARMEKDLARIDK